MTEQTPLDGKKIVLGVTGSIAAYKAADLVRLLIKAGAEVKVVMTQAASEFITPLTMQTLSGSPVAMTLLDADEESTMGHIQLARWADWVLIAPASANTLAGLAHGRTEDLLTALCLATTAPIAVAPAMNNKMWSNGATQTNLATIADRGILVLGPATGEQACGEQGEGRLLEPELLITELSHLILPTKLSAIATAAAQAGAEVILITGPVALATPPEVQRVDVETAQQMFEAIEKIEQIDIFIGCAAVADYRPEQYSESKLKKAVETQRAIQVTENKDIIAAVAQRQVKPFIVGFAAETDDIINYAKDKMERKQLDMIAANLVGKGLGFGVDTNTLYVFWQQGEAVLPLALKSHLARDLMRLIIDRYDAKNSA